MNLLLDTNVLIWTLDAPQKLSPEFIAEIESPENEVFVSSVSIWEVITKAQIGKLEIPPKFEETLERQGFKLLEFKAVHAFEVMKLQFIHRDPFDRAILAQASFENFTLLTSDKTLRSYSDQVKVRAMN